MFFMKDLQGSLIFAMCLLAFTAVVFFFKYGQQRVHSQLVEAENLAAQNQARGIELKASEAMRLSRIAEETAVANIRKAKEAREMLERAKRTSELSQKEIVDRLNAQLEREADARISAEKASAELSKQRDILAKTVAQTKSDLERLRIQKSSNKEYLERIAQMQELLKKREAEIEELKKRQAELERLNEEARKEQASTELEIEKRGGIVLLPRHKRILSPNIRRGGYA